MRARAQTAFTYLEGVIVLMLVGIMAMIAVPMVGQTLSGAKLSGVADEAVAALEFAQLTALNSGRPCRVSFDAGTDTLSVARLEGPDLLGETYGEQSSIPEADVEAEGLITLPHPLRSGDLYRLVFADEAHLEGANITAADFGGEANVQFDALGNPSAGGAVTLRYGSRQATVSVDAMTGKVTRTD